MKRPGFTLLEVILALTILAGAMAVLGEVSRLALRNASAARDLARAQLLAESKLAEILAGITSPDPVENTAFDRSSNSLDPSEPGWLYSISSESTDEDGLISVRVTVTRDIPAGQHPVKFSLVRWLPDPNYVYTPPASSSSTGSSSGS
ncbi:MAG: prepilin-type N-terminal cleavage/methylation domain-containing protein [Thermoguttaceae bacterium]